MQSLRCPGDDVKIRGWEWLGCFFELEVLSVGVLV